MSSINGGVQGLKINLTNLMNDKNEKITVDGMDLNFIFECLLSENVNDMSKAKEYLSLNNVTFLFEENGEEPLEVSFFTNNGQLTLKNEHAEKYICTGEFKKYENSSNDIIKVKIESLKESVNFYCNFTKNFWID